MNSTKKRLAIMTPWPPAHTGVADYMYRILPYMEEYFDIDVYSDVAVDPSDGYDYSRGINLYQTEELEERTEDYHVVLCEIGNNSIFHRTIFEYARKHPALVEMHDGNISELLRDVDADGSGIDEIATNAIGFIFHNEYDSGHFQSEKRRLIPLAAFSFDNKASCSENKVNEILRQKCEILDDYIVIGIFGYIIPNKRPDIVLRAIRYLVNRKMKVKAVFWGSDSGCETMKHAAELGLAEHVTVTGYLSEEEYRAGLSISDIILNLRYPSKGESSATLCEAFCAAKPVIVTDKDQYSDFSDDICWKLPVYSNPNKEGFVLAALLEELINEPQTRTDLGKRAYDYAVTELDPSRIAARYAEVINSFTA